MQARGPRVLAAIATALAASVGFAADPVPLGKAEVQRLIGGKTMRVAYVDPIDLELAADGRFRSHATASGIRGAGTWSVDDQGRLCLKSPSPLLNGCRGVQRGDRGLGMTKPDGTGFFAIGDIR
jgi:hypothetical protein